MPSNTSECTRMSCLIVEVEIGGSTIYRDTTLLGISLSEFVLSLVWCSRRTTGVPVAPCRNEFLGRQSDYVRQVVLEATTARL
ncbi:hypothetical protein TNCV_1931771 [Trichonephila clavipes]|nr:hypothetical protein TNCV_1931771 [Trichonephila clavipes]